MFKVIFILSLILILLASACVYEFARLMLFILSRLIFNRLLLNLLKITVIIISSAVMVLSGFYIFKHITLGC